MADTLEQKRRDAVDARIQAIKNIAGPEPMTRERLAHILQELLALAAQTEFWTAPEYAEPAGDSLQARYLIHEEPDHTFALYLNVMLPGKKIVPHNHTTWACIAAVVGSEDNYLYRRTDDGGTPGHATLEHTDTVDVRPGTGIALLADDIHAVHINGHSAIRHLHMYGRALETLDQRVAYDLDTGRYDYMNIGVQTRR